MKIACIIIATLVVVTVFVVKNSYDIVKLVVRKSTDAYTEVNAEGFNAIFQNPNESTKPEYPHPESKYANENSYPFVYSFKENFFPGVFSRAKHNAVRSFYAIITKYNFYLDKIGSFFQKINYLNSGIAIFTAAKLFWGKTTSRIQKVFGFNVNRPILIIAVLVTNVVSRHFAVNYNISYFTYVFSISNAGEAATATFKNILSGGTDYFSSISLIKKCPSIITSTLHPYILYLEHVSDLFSQRNLISQVTSHFTSLDVISGKCNNLPYIDVNQQAHILKKKAILAMHPNGYPSHPFSWSLLGIDSVVHSIHAITPRTCNQRMSLVLLEHLERIHLVRFFCHVSPVVHSTEYITTVDTTVGENPSTVIVAVSHEDKAAFFREYINNVADMDVFTDKGQIERIIAEPLQRQAVRCHYTIPEDENPQESNAVLGNGNANARIAFLNYDPKIAAQLIQFDIDIKNFIRHMCDDRLKYEFVNSTNVSEQGYSKKPHIYGNTLVRKVFDFEKTIKESWPELKDNRKFRWKVTGEQIYARLLEDEIKLSIDPIGYEAECVKKTNNLVCENDNINTHFDKMSTWPDIDYVPSIDPYSLRSSNASWASGESGQNNVHRREIR